MDDKIPGLILGYHGCDREVGERLLAGKEHIRKSTNSFDWLGHGAYFWENDPERALEYAHRLRDGAQKGHSVVKEPFAVGAVLDLGNCLNLLRARHLDIVKDFYEEYVKYQQAQNLPIPENKKSIGQDSDLSLRHLDCAVIEFLHTVLDKKAQPSFDSVRGAFLEEARLYHNAGFSRRTHIQICVRNMDCVKAYFRIPKI